MPDMQEDARLVDGRYEVVRRLGSGGMGRVYLAHDRILERPVAIKLLRGDVIAAGDRAETEDVVRRFRAEAQHSARLSHPNVVEIYDSGEDPDRGPYISMEYVPGITLAAVLRRERGPLSPREAVAIAQGVALALDAAHSKGVIHRDIKPQNILLDGAPPRGVKVVDFGIAKAAEAHAASAAATRTNVVLGTVRYLSPEQAAGSALEPASDLYSLGVVLYEMLTATVPFEAENPVAVALKHVSERPPSPKVLNPRVPLPLADLTLRLLSKAPEDRPAPARRLPDELERALLPSGEAPPPARTASARPGSRPAPRPNRAKALLAASALLSALALPALVLADAGAVGRLIGVAPPPNDPVAAVAEPLHGVAPEPPAEPPAPERETEPPAEPAPSSRLQEEPPPTPATEPEPHPPAEPPAIAAPDGPVAAPPPDPQRSQYAPQVQAPAPPTREARPAPSPAPAPAPDPAPAPPPGAAPEPLPGPAPAPPPVPQQEAEPSPTPGPDLRAQRDNADPPVPAAPPAPRAADPSPPGSGEDARPGLDEDPEPAGGGRRG